MHINLTGKTALVTGGGVGIGRGIALALGHAGADVAITYRTHHGAPVAEEIERYGRRATAYSLDLTESGEVDEVFEEAAAFLGGAIDILVNNAGGLIDRVAIAEMSDKHWQHVVDLNLTSAFYASRAVLRHMPDGGRIINISSLAAHTGGGHGATAYAAAKAGMHGLTRGLAKELGPRLITVNAVAPGLILDTPFHDTFTPEANRQATVDATPIGRAGFPADVAGAVLYFVSDLSSFCTGTTLELNGGTYFG